MAVRPIDGNAIKRRVWNITEAWKEVGQERDALLVKSVVDKIVDTQPTLTPPNELLTCEGCDMQGEKVTPCASCIRDPRVCDYYTACRLPEGAG